MSVSDPLRLDPSLAEQLDIMDAQIAEERQAEVEAALVELDIDRKALYDVPDVRVIDTETYDDDPQPTAERTRIPRKRVDGHVITSPGARLDTKTMQLTGPVRPPTISPAKQAREIARIAENKAKRRVQENRELDRLSNAFLESLAEEEELRRALALSDSPKAESFLKDLSNPRYNRARWTVSALAYKNGLKPSDVATIFRTYKLAEGSRVAISAIPEVMKDIVEDAKSTQEVCPRCDGLKIIERRTKTQVEDPVSGEMCESERVEWLDCPNCNATGAIRKAGDTHARKVLTEMAEYTGKKGPLIQQNFIGGHNVASVVEDLEDFGNAPIIDSTAYETT